jgi:hypothetical protein
VWLRSSRLAVLLAVAAIAGVGCGGNDDGGSQRLSGAELEQARESSDAIRGYCRDVAAFLAGRRERPSAAEGDRTLAAADQLIALARTNPDAAYDRAQTMRDLVGNLTEDLEGTNCSPVLVRRLNDGFETIPARKTAPSY